MQTGETEGILIESFTLYAVEWITSGRFLLTETGVTNDYYPKR